MGTNNCIAGTHKGRFCQHRRHPTTYVPWLDMLGVKPLANEPCANDIPLYYRTNVMGTRNAAACPFSQGLEADKSKIDENLRILQAEATQLRDDRGGVDGSDESEALQKDLLVTLTDLAQASTEVLLLGEFPRGRNGPRPDCTALGRLVCFCYVPDR